jgi:sodium/potassium-transporting ATPase subunit alpha
LEEEKEKEKIKNLHNRIAKRREKLNKKFNIQEDTEKSMNKSIEDAEKFKKIDDHRITLTEFCKRYGTSLETGLSEAEAADRIAKEGENKLSEKEGTHPFIEFLIHMSNFFSLLLWAGAILCFVAYALSPEDQGNLYLGIVITAIVNLSALIEFLQNRKSKALMDSFKNFSPP